ARGARSRAPVPDGHHGGGDDHGRARLGRDRVASAAVSLAAFLPRERAPAPGRLRGTLRIAIGCLAATLSGYVIGASISPHAHWVITTVFTVSQPDVGASLRKAGQRLVGTVIGGGLGILAVVAFADLPVMYVPVLGAVVALGLFLSMTSTAPYVMMLGTLTFVLVSFIP